MSNDGWQDRLIRALGSGVDGAQIDRQLALSPTERLENMLRFLEFAQAARDHHDRPTQTS